MTRFIIFNVLLLLSPCRTSDSFCFVFFFFLFFSLRFPLHSAVEYCFQVDYLSRVPVMQLWSCRLEKSVLISSYSFAQLFSFVHVSPSGSGTNICCGARWLVDEDRARSMNFARSSVYKTLCFQNLSLSLSLSFFTLHLFFPFPWF